VHVASASALEPISAARARGVRVTAETCPHYLTFCAEDIEDGAVEYKCAPPIRERADNERLWQAVASGVLDLVASDHSPAPPELKQVATGDFARAWGGIAGLQFGLRALWTGGRSRGVDLARLADLLCAGPARILRLDDRGVLAAGLVADLVVWDPESRAVVTGAEVLHRHKLTPYVGRELAGRIERTIVGGRIAYSHGKVVGPPHGALLTARRPWT
jgi:allantoinase